MSYKDAIVGVKALREVLVLLPGGEQRIVSEKPQELSGPRVASSKDARACASYNGGEQGGPLVVRTLLSALFAFFIFFNTFEYKMYQA